MTRKVTISCDKISSKQWSVLLIELNLMRQQWARFAPLKIESPDFERTVKWSKRKHNEKDEE